MSDAWDGRPQQPERDGWHWVSYLDPDIPPQGIFWSCEHGKWEGVREWLAPSTLAHSHHYLGPCLTPAEVATSLAAARQAEREAAAAVCRTKANDLRNYEHTRFVAGLCAVAILSQPAPEGADTLATQIATAEQRGRRMGIEAAAEVCRTWAQDHLCVQPGQGPLVAAIRALAG